MMERYKFIESEADSFSDFMIPMLQWDQERRASAKEVLEKSAWLNMAQNENYKMSEKQHNAYMLK